MFTVQSVKPHCVNLIRDNDSTPFRVRVSSATGQAHHIEQLTRRGDWRGVKTDTRWWELAQIAAELAHQNAPIARMMADDALAEALAVTPTPREAETATAAARVMDAMNIVRSRLDDMRYLPSVQQAVRDAEDAKRERRRVKYIAERYGRDECISWGLTL